MANHKRIQKKYLLLQLGIFLYQLEEVLFGDINNTEKIIKSIHLVSILLQFFTIIYFNKTIFKHLLLLLNNTFLMELFLREENEIQKALICIYHTYQLKKSKTLVQKLIVFSNNLIYSIQLIIRIAVISQATKNIIIQSLLLFILLIHQVLIVKKHNLKQLKQKNENESKNSFNEILQKSFKDSKVQQIKLEEHKSSKSNRNITIDTIQNLLPIGMVILDKNQKLMSINNYARTILESEYGEIHNKEVYYIKKSLNKAINQQNQTKNQIQTSPKNQQKSSNQSVNINNYKQSIGFINRCQSKSQFYARNPKSHHSIRLENQISSDFDAINYILEQQQQDPKYSIKPIKPNQHEQLIKNYKAEQIDSIICQNYVETVFTVKQGDKSKKRCIRFRIFNSYLSNDSFTSITVITLENKTKKIKYNDYQLKHQFQNMLLNSFSHELKTPLNSSLQLLETFEQFFNNNELLETYIRPSLNSLRLLAHQFNDILDFASFESNQFKYEIQSFSMIRLLNQCKSFYLEAMKAKELDFQIIIDSVIDEISNDSQRITQVLITLLNNSVKFTNKKGIIKIRFKARLPKLFSITIEDNGVGIDPKKLYALQKCLSSLEDDDIESQIKDYDESSTGLGLKIASKIVSGFVDKKKFEIQNQLKIKSKPHEFTKIKFYLQDYKNSTVQLDFQNQNEELDQNSIMVSDNSFYLHERVTQLKKTKRQTKVLFIQHLKIQFIINQCECPKILIVDDVPFNHYALNIQLTNYKLISDSVFNGQEAIDKVKEKLLQGCGENCRHGYYLILMDIQMPVKDGYQASFEVKLILQLFKINEFLDENDYSQTQIIICSAYDSIEHRNEAKICGVDQFLPKPVKREELYQAIKNII